MSKKELIKIDYWDTPKKDKTSRCGYCGKEIPAGTWWCSSIHRFWNQVCGKTRYGSNLYN